MEDTELRDITDIPYFPFEPGTFYWGIFIVFAALLILYIKIKSKKNKASSKTKALDSAISELESLKRNLKDGADTRDFLFKASLLLRRLISSTTKVDLSSFTETDFENIKKSGDVKIDLFITHLIDLEKLKYKKDSGKDAPLELLTNLIQKLTLYKNGQTS